MKRRADEADAKALAFGEAKMRGHRAQFLGAFENLHRLLEKHPPGLGELDRACAAMDETQTELGLEILDLPGKWRLGDVEALGGPGKILRARDRDEISKIPFGNSGMREPS